MSVAEHSDPHNWRTATGATGLLAAFNDAGVLETADVHVASRLTALAREPRETVALAAALAVRALRGGSVCVDLRAVAAQSETVGLPWPAPDAWLTTLRASRLLADPPVLRLHADSLLYLDRYWREEQQVCDDLVALLGPRSDASFPVPERLFSSGYPDQRSAAEIAVAQSVTVLTGGPGTGKTTTVARLLALLTEQAESFGRRPRVALAAPTGKAAARLAEAVRLESEKLHDVDQQRLSGLRAVTLHRLLGRKPGSSNRFRHDRANRLPHDVIVVDETSMVSLTMMARLLEAVRGDARLVLVGDRDQLASVEAGAVLADLVDGLGGRSDTRIATLTTSHRFDKSIGALAAAIRSDDPDRVVEVLRAGGPDIEWIDGAASTDRIRAVAVPHALRLREAALQGVNAAALAALGEHRLLCAHRHGPYGVAHYNRQVQRWLTEETGDAHWSPWYPGRPVLVTANDYGLGVLNGETGVTVLRDGELRTVIDGADHPLEFAISRLSDVETMHAMTIHKSQGSQAHEVTVVLPSTDSRLLTRELFYTAVTRAESKVRVVGSEASVRAALARRAVRASGLADRLRR